MKSAVLIFYLAILFNFFINLDFLRATVFFLKMPFWTALSSFLIMSFTMSELFVSLALMATKVFLARVLISLLMPKFLAAFLILLRRSFLACFVCGIFYKRKNSFNLIDLDDSCVYNRKIYTKSQELDILSLFW